MIEIDGPPMIHICHLDNEGKDIDASAYITLGIAGRDVHKVTQCLMFTVQLIKDELLKHHDSILYWRRRPCVSYDDEQHLFNASCRLQTEPKLGDEFWSVMNLTKKVDESMVSNEN